MSGIVVAIQALLDTPAVVNVVGNRVFAVYAEPDQAAPFIIVSLAAESSEEDLEGPTGSYTTRVSVECIGKSGNAPQAIQLGELVKGALGGITDRAIAGFVTTIMKEDSDVSDFSDQRRLPRRILDFSVRWERP